MSEIQINPGVIAAAVCSIMCILSIASSVVFRIKNNNSGENPGTVFSLILGAPFFLSLCYLLCCLMEKIGETI